MKSLMVIITIIILSFSFIFTVNGQNTRLELSQLGIFSSEDFSQAKIYFNQETELKEITLAKTRTVITYNAWGIQIYMGSGKNSRAVAESTLNSFKAKYPDVETRLKYPSPYFKVQVGNYKTRIEAESFRQKILGEYPNARIESVTSKE
jgi:hypothetical protein